MDLNVWNITSDADDMPSDLGQAEPRSLGGSAKDVQSDLKSYIYYS